MTGPKGLPVPMAEDWNFFLMLEIPPEERDPAKLRAIIETRKRLWTDWRNSGSPALKRKAEQRRDLLSQFLATAEDVKALERHAQALRAVERAQREGAENELKLAVQTFAASHGTYTPEDVSALRRTISSTLVDDSAVISALEAAGLRKQAAPAPSKAPDLLPSTTMDKIRGDLELVKKRDLYDLLGVGEGATCTALMKAADDLYKQTQKKGGGDAVNLAHSRLAGEARTCFADSQSRARYDASREHEVFQHRSFAVVLTVATGDGLISPREMEQLIRTAAELGLGRDATLRLLRQREALGAWRIQAPEAGTTVELPQCGRCQSIAHSPDEAACRRCGAALSTECPRCGTRAAASSRACTRCGAPVADAPVVADLVVRGRAALEAGDLDAAKASLTDALGLWPDHGPARAEMTRVDAAIAERKAQTSILVQLERDRRMYEAAALLARLSEPRPAELVELAARVGRAIVAAEAAIAEAQAAEHGASRLTGARRDAELLRAVEICERALSMASDCTAARQGLARMPPPAPTQVTVTPIAQGLRISWKPPAAHVPCRVLRRRGGFPRGPDDGELVEVTTAHQVDDTSAEPGVAWYYAVAALRGPVASVIAHGPNPVLRTAEVGPIDVGPGSRSVALRWKPPPGATCIEVWRAPGTPPTRGQGIRVATLNGMGTSYLDTTPDNGTPYGYRVVVGFDDPGSGGPIWTAGRTATATPSEPPPAVERMACELNGQQAVLSWDPLPGTRVHLRLATRLPTVTAHTSVPTAQLDSMGTPVQEERPGRARVELPPEGQVWLMPVSVTGDVATVGQIVPLTSVPTVHGLGCVVVNGSIVATWIWPPGIQEVGLGFSIDAPVHVPEQPGTAWQRLRRDAYDRQQGAIVRPTRPARHHVSVFALGRDGVSWSAPAVTTVSMGQELRVTYRVVKQRSFWSGTRASIVFEAEAATELVDLMIVGATKDPPLTPEAGRLLGRIQRLEVRPGMPAEWPVPAGLLGAQLMVKVFHTHPERALDIRLLPSARSALQLP